MCGRYDNLIAREAYRGFFATDRLPDWNFPPRYNVAPTDQVPIVLVAEGLAEPYGTDPATDWCAAR
jgi:putative SOS response-associated peptidase YedK